jgi:hypothetical protein
MKLITCMKILSQQGEWYMIMSVTSVSLKSIDVANKHLGLLQSVGNACQKYLAYFVDEKKEKGSRTL